MAKKNDGRRAPDSTHEMRERMTFRFNETYLKAINIVMHQFDCDASTAVRALIDAGIRQMKLH